MTMASTVTSMTTAPWVLADTPTAAWIPAFRPTGPDVLALAAHILPDVIAPGLLLSFHIHPALVEAVTRLGLGDDRYHRLRLADEARDMLAEFLVIAGLAVRDVKPGRTVAGWMIYGAGHDLALVQAALLAAAGFWRAELGAALPAVVAPQPAVGVVGW